MHEKVHKNGLEKPYSWYLVISQAFYKEWAEISMESTINASFTGLSTIEQWNMCLKNMTVGMVPWYGLTMPWLKAKKVWFMSSCTPFINRTITEEVQCFREGNHQDWRGIQISVLVCHSVFFQRSTYRLNFKFDIFPNSFTIFRGLCAFSRH